MPGWRDISLSCRWSVMSGWPSLRARTGRNLAPATARGRDGAAWEQALLPHVRAFTCPALGVGPPPNRRACRVITRSRSHGRHRKRCFACYSFLRLKSHEAHFLKEGYCSLHFDFFRSLIFHFFVILFKTTPVILDTSIFLWMRARLYGADNLMILTNTNDIVVYMDRIR